MFALQPQTERMFAPCGVDGYTVLAQMFDTEGASMSYQRELTKRQQEILDYVRAEVHRCGYPPSVREIGLAVGLSSSSTVHSHLAALESKGFIRRDPSKPRALEVLDFRETERGIDYGSVRAVPVVGQVAAGQPILASENIEQTMSLPAEIADEATFILRVRGESMIEVGIMDGDFVVVRQQSTATNGDIVVAMLGEDATVKTFYRETDRIRLQPENSSMEPIYAVDVSILGKVVALFRRL
jgi:repressor LexA